MKLEIKDKNKKNIFISLFQVLKNCSSLINCKFYNEYMHIQGMDKSHICLYDLTIKKKWFDFYIASDDIEYLCFDSNIFYSIISVKSDNLNLIINNENDNLNIHFVSQEKTNTESNQETNEKVTKKTNKKKESKESKDNKKDFHKYFTMPLCDYDYDEMNVSNADYDAEFLLSSKQISEIFDQLNNFGDNIIIKCSEEDIHLTSKEINGEMCVHITIDDLSSYSITENTEINLTYSLTYLNKMCITNKITEEIEFSLSEKTPMKITYHLDEDSLLVFFIAPKVDD